MRKWCQFIFVSVYQQTIDKYLLLHYMHVTTRHDNNKEVLFRVYVFVEYKRKMTRWKKKKLFSCQKLNSFVVIGIKIRTSFFVQIFWIKCASFHFGVDGEIERKTFLIFLWENLYISFIGQNKYTYIDRLRSLKG